MNILKRTIFKIASSEFLQRLLEKNILLSQRLTGIGSGTDVQSSGEEILIKKLLKIKSDKLIIFDVGANAGRFSEMILRSLNDKINFQLHSFEPSHFTFLKLKERIIPTQKVFLNNFGLGKKEGTAELFYDKEASGLASLTKRRLEHFNINFNRSENVEIKTVDSYCSSTNINHIDLLKIDVEGHELEVLEGSRKMFARNAVRMVSFEFGGCNIDTRTYYQDFYYFFKDYKMKIYRIIPSAKLIPMKGYKEIYEQFRTTNFLAIRDENR